MNPQTEKLQSTRAPNIADAEPNYAPQTRLVGVYFNRSVMFQSEMESASVWRPGPNSGAAPSNSVDSIKPAWLLDDGAVENPTPQTRPSDGLVLRKRVHDLHTGKRKVLQTFVPWANVRSISYGE